MPIVPSGPPMKAPFLVWLSYKLSNAVYRFGVWLAGKLNGPHWRWDDRLPSKVHGRSCPTPVLREPKPLVRRNAVPLNPSPSKGGDDEVGS